MITIKQMKYFLSVCRTENLSKSAKELLAYSKKMMQGNKFKLLYIHISFIPWFIFGVITLFIPLLWVSVYRYATLTAFYQDLIVKYGNAGKVDYGLN